MAFFPLLSICPLSNGNWYYLKSFYEHIKKKRGSAKAITATARKFLITIFYTLKNNWVFKDFTKFEISTGQ